MRLSITFFALIVLMAGSALSCSFDPAGLNPGGTDAASDSTVPDADAADVPDVVDAATDADAHHDAGDGGSECTAADNECLDYYRLNVCTGTGEMTQMTCPYGCDPSVPTCFELTPSNGVDPSLVLTPGVGDWYLSTDALLITDTGEIIINGNQYRIPGAGLDTNTGIYFDVITLPDGTQAGLFVFQNLTLVAGATLTAHGDLPLILLADTTMIAGVVDVSAKVSSCSNDSRTCAGPGGFMGGNANRGGQGPGAGGAGKDDYWGDESGGGGAGYLTAGGKGGGGDGGNAGGVYGTDSCEPLLGGSGGGGGGHNTPTSTSTSQGKGGGGGGAVQISALSY
ncbi:hypothetical protein KKF84_21740, partial [Myxococcota bacterium]|nr:hypothetical protein [Myxococcota bacterium]MBU1537950.1 hypothetical protein [Myxococcota bacterium]